MCLFSSPVGGFAEREVTMGGVEVRGWGGVVMGAWRGREGGG